MAIDETGRNRFNANVMRKTEMAHLITTGFTIMMWSNHDG